VLGRDTPAQGFVVSARSTTAAANTAETYRNTVSTVDAASAWDRPRTHV
jgi:hypothetical protein